MIDPICYNFIQFKLFTIICRWQSTHKDDPYVLNSLHVVRGKRGNSAICRGYFQNTLVPGGTTSSSNQCAAYFFEKLVFLDDFEVLVDQTLTSRYEWVKWDIFTKIPVGSVGKYIFIGCQVLDQRNSNSLINLSTVCLHRIPKVASFC